MEIQVKKGKYFQEKGDVLIFPVYEEEIRSGDLKLLDRQNHGKISEILDSGEFRGKRNQTVALHALAGLKARKILLVGLGPVKKGELDTIREAFGKAACRARAMGAVTIVSGIRQELVKKEKLRDIAQAMTEGVMLGLYRFTLYKTEQEEEPQEIRTWVLAIEDGKKAGDVEKGVLVGKIVSEG
ncbi:MAG TPA: M17 family peptidase N-terminal domain-containing protein, partial [Nitrospiria bacterium]|nr:M17 family peptidase N-terminal domain-containing protein [Nitrospiria bacterium]